MYRVPDYPLSDVRVVSPSCMRKRMKYINGTILFVATFLFGYAVFSAGPAALVRNAKDSLAAVGISASIAPNEYNSVAQQLAEKEARLNREQADLAAQQRNNPSSRYAFYSLCVSILLFILVAINFYFDIRRGSTTGKRARLSVDLR